MSLNLIYWLVSTVCAYGAASFLLAYVIRAIGDRKYTTLIYLGVVVVVAIITTQFLPPKARMLSLSVVIACGSLLVWRINPTQSVLFLRREFQLALVHVVMISISAVLVVPFAWLFSTALKSDRQTSAYPPIWLPHPLMWSNFPDALKFLPAASFYGLVNLENTLVISVLSVIGTLLSSSLVAYGFARLKWPGRDWVFGIVLATMMLPGAVTMIPQFLIFRSLHWINTLLPLWVPSFFASAFNVFLLRQFFLGIPQEYEDAAKIDGCNHLMTWWHIMLPMIKSALAAVAIMTFMASWKDFMGPLIYISSPEKMPIAYALQQYNSARGVQPSLLMAATTMVLLPVVVLFFFTQRYFFEGANLSGLRGR